MRDILLVVQILVSLFLILTISLQTKGGGLARTWVASTPSTKRGLEKLIFRLSFILVFLFIFISIIQVIL